MFHQLVKKLGLTVEQVSGNSQGKCILVKVAEGKRYEGGKITDVVDHLKCTCVFPDQSFEKLIVKVKDLDIGVTNEDIEKAGGSLFVTLKGLTGKFYKTTSGEYAISASAESLEVNKNVN